MQNTDQYLVSVCVITYNHEKYISECLDSILSQKTNFKFNVIVSDDCSTDKTFEILKSYESRFPNVKVISRCGLPKSYANGKPTGNLNFFENMGYATGQYIAICDGDDVWNSNEKLQVELDILQRDQSIALVCSARNKIKDNVFYPNKLVIPDIEIPYWVLCFYNPIPTSSVVFRQELMKPQPKWFFELEMGDWPMWFSVVRGQKFFKLSKAYVDYRIHSAGAWGKMTKSQKALSALSAVKTMRKEYGDIFFRISILLHTLRYQFHKLRESIL